MVEQAEKDGVAGYLIKGVSEEYEDKSIFLPSAGYVTAATLTDATTSVYSFTSTPNSSAKTSAMDLEIKKSVPSVFRNSRYRGLPIRPVRSAK